MNLPTSDTIVDADLCVLIIAPIGRDAALAQKALSNAAIESEIFLSLGRASEAISSRNIGALLVSEEVLSRNNVEVLAEILKRQLPWSDLPILILTISGRASELSRKREQERLPLGTITLLERPIRTSTLISSIRSALRSRRRQYQVRDTLLERDRTLKERDRAEKARLASENRLLMAMEAAHLGAWELNLATGSLHVSEVVRRAFHWPTDMDLTYKSLIARVHLEDRQRLSALHRNAISDRSGYTADFRIVWPEGTVRWISAMNRFLTDEADGSGLHSGTQSQAGATLTGVILDITDRVLSEEALRKADKLALAGRLASSIAHEINNPLESVTNLLYLISDSDLGPTEREYVTTAQQELARVSEIAAQTLTFNRQQNTHGKSSLVEILESVLVLYRGRLLHANIEVCRKYLYGEPILCYPGELRQVFINLVGNAFDAMRQGGRLYLRERLCHDPLTDQIGIRITIADSGCGIPSEMQTRLFEAFQSTKGNNGTGLGLWISKGIIEKHGGRIRFRSSTQEGRSGTVFSIFLRL